MGKSSGIYKLEDGGYKVDFCDPMNDGMYLHALFYGDWAKEQAERFFEREYSSLLKEKTCEAQ